MTHDDIKTQLNGNHGSCLGVLKHLVDMDAKSLFVVEVAVNHAKRILMEHDNLVIKQQELWADESVDQDKWRGDHCGYLSAQCAARTVRGLTPTEDQQEAWEACNTTSPLEEKLSSIEYFEER